MFLQRFLLTSAVVLTMAVTTTLSLPVKAGDAGAFIGGMVTSRVLNNMGRRTRAEEVQAQNSSNTQPVQQAQPEQSPQQKIDQLDKLAAGGYITPEEYKVKKKAIMNGM